MKPPPSPSRWAQLLDQARADLPPPSDLLRLLAVLRREPLAAAPGWRDGLCALGELRGLVSGCVAGAAALLLTAAWQVVAWWDLLPWVQWTSAGMGGGL